MKKTKVPRKTLVPSRQRNKYKSNSVIRLDSDDSFSDAEHIDPNAEDYFNDDIDNFHANQDKILLGDKSFHHQEESSEEEEVLPISDGEEYNDSENDIDESDDAYQKDDMASDLEDNEEKGLPDAKAWGKKKSAYYNADFVDEDRGRSYWEKDREAAEAEEKEALAIQKRLAAELSEEDFGLEWFKRDKKTDEKDEVEETVVQDLSGLTTREQIELLKKKSPEFLELVNDFKTKLREAEEYLQPLLPLIQDGQIPAGPGADYLILKYQLILHYCTNISFYMILMSQGTPVDNHPVIKRLNSYKKLLKNLEPIDKKLDVEINWLLQKLKKGEEIHITEPTNRLQEQNSTLESIRAVQKYPQTQKRQIKEGDQEATGHPKKLKTIKKFETEDEKEVLAWYMEMKEKQKEKLNEISEERGDEQIEPEDENEHEEEIPDEKRAINYQIAKNKGLTPYRKKEYRNPRVRHRMKYRKAKIRRKGQVREPRTEIHRYGGEPFGISVGVSKSRKLK